MLPVDTHTHTIFIVSFFNLLVIMRFYSLENDVLAQNGKMTVCKILHLDTVLQKAVQPVCVFLGLTLFCVLKPQIDVRGFSLEVHRLMTYEAICISHRELVCQKQPSVTSAEPHSPLLHVR